MRGLKRFQRVQLCPTAEQTKQRICLEYKVHPVCVCVYKLSQPPNLKIGPSYIDPRNQVSATVIGAVI